MRNDLTGNDLAENVIIVDEQNQFIKNTQRSEMRAQNLIHRASYIFVFSPLGALLVQRRTATKDVFPGYWDLAAGGVVDAGEDYQTAAVRELGEELGIYHQALQHHGEFFYSDDQCQVWGAIYTLIWEGDIHHQSSEIDEVAYLSVEDIPDFLSSQNITPTTLKAYKQLLGID